MDIKNLSKSLYKDQGTQLTKRLQIAINQISNGDKVLEIGVGWGELTEHIKELKDIDLYVVDVAESSLEKVKGLTKDSQLADISTEKLKFEDNQFDSVVCLEVFEHLQNPYFALEEIQRVLKPSGKLIISIPNHLGGHIMIYPGLISARAFKLFLRQNYFQIQNIHSWGTVINKGNMGRILNSKLGNNLFSTLVLKLIQIPIKVLQFITQLIRVNWFSLFWCYTYVCVNKKSETNTPFWVKQLEQTSDLKENKSWYDPCFHKKV